MTRKGGATAGSIGNLGSAAVGIGTAFLMVLGVCWYPWICWGLGGGVLWIVAVFRINAANILADILIKDS